jgi:hypothetical protein
MNDQLAQRVVYNVHSYIRDFFRPELHPDSVLKLLYEDGQFYWKRMIELTKLNSVHKIRFPIFWSVFSI